MDLKLRLQRVLQIVEETERVGAMSDLERDIVLGELREAYMSVKFGVAESATEPIASAPLQQEPDSEVDSEEDNEPEVEFEIIFNEEEDEEEDEEEEEEHLRECPEELQLDLENKRSHRNDGRSAGIIHLPHLGPSPASLSGSSGPKAEKSRGGAEEKRTENLVNFTCSRVSGH